MSGSDLRMGPGNNPTGSEKRLESVDGSLQAVLTCSHRLEEPDEEERQRRPRARVRGERPRGQGLGVALWVSTPASSCPKTRLIRGRRGTPARPARVRASFSGFDPSAVVCRGRAASYISPSGSGTNREAWIEQQGGRPADDDSGGCGAAHQVDRSAPLFASSSSSRSVSRPGIGLPSSTTRMVA